MIAALKSGRAFELMEHFRLSIPTSHATSGNSGKKVGLKLRLADGLSRQRQARQKKHHEAAVRLSGPHPELDRWIQFVSAVLTGHHADWIGILVHWYGGNITTEAIAAKNRNWLTLSNFTEQYLLNAEEDTLHTITLNAHMT